MNTEKTPKGITETKNTTETGLKKADIEHFLRDLEKPRDFTVLFEGADSENRVIFHKLAVLGATPGAGKTSLALQCASRAALKGQPVIIYSFEMDKSSVLARMLYQLLECEAENERDGILSLKRRNELFTEKGYKQFEQVCENLYITDISDCFRAASEKEEKVLDFSILKEIPKINTAKANTEKTPLVIFDSLQEIPMPGQFGNQKEKIDKALSQLRALTDSTESNVLVISQQSRTGQRENNLTSFLGSAGIEYTVDSAFLLVEDKDLKTVTLKTEKNRYAKKSPDKELKMHNMKFFGNS